MPVPKSTIARNYEEILKKDHGAEFMKVDLHIHTPASGDAQWKNRYNFKFNTKKHEESLNTVKKLAVDIVNDVIGKQLRVIAVTDHNTPSNVHPEELKHTWYEHLKTTAEGKDLCVLPGIEISTDDMHILVILDPGDEPVTHTIQRINFLLRDCRFPLKDYGNYKATGQSSIYDVLKYVQNLGTSSIVIPAHIDGGNKSLLDAYRGPSDLYRILMEHIDLNAVEVVEHSAPDRKIGKKSVQDYFNEKRGDNRSPVAFIQDSDAHTISKIGHRHTYIRMGRPGFWPLKNALESPETRVRMPDDYRPDTSKTSITGIAFRTGGNWSYIAFNSSLNCIIGKKQTNKSTLVDLIVYGLDRFEDKEEEKELIEKKYAVNIFLTRGSDVICYSRDAASQKPEIYRYQDNSFVPATEQHGIELPRKYNHKAIQEIFKSSTDLTDFLDRHIFGSDKMLALREERDHLLKELKDRNFEDCTEEMKQLVKACKGIFKEREKLIEPALENYKNDMFRIKITEGKRTGERNQDYFDKAVVSLSVGRKYIPLSKLSTGERNAAMMVLMMNQGAFGPLIIDEPEQYIDVKSITGMLVPRMRRLKTQQQIICVTRDEHILISGDAEQVIVTQAEDKLKVKTGDINNEEVQKHIIEIFEGDKYALLAKSRKLRQILD